MARVPRDIDRQRVRFVQGDACNLPDLLPFDAVLAANLLCRLPDPLKFLTRLPVITKRNGIVVLISPYSWLESWTPKAKWLGGFTVKSKRTEEGDVQMRSVEGLRRVMVDLGFELVHQEDTPFLIREHLRKFQWGVSHTTVWRKGTMT